MSFLTTWPNMKNCSFKTVFRKTKIKYNQDQGFVSPSNHNLFLTTNNLIVRSFCTQLQITQDFWRIQIHTLFTYTKNTHILSLSLSFYLSHAHLLSVSGNLKDTHFYQISLISLSLFFFLSFFHSFFLSFFLSLSTINKYVSL